MERYIFRMLPDDLRLEEKIDLESRFMKLISLIPIFRYFVARYLIKRGIAYARVWKVDPLLPEEFTLQGWTVRNCSERQDGVYLKNRSGVTLNPKLK